LIKAEDLVLPSVAALNPYEPGKPIEEVQRELGVEPVKLASNENPVGPSPRAVAAVAAALGELNRYPDGSSWAVRHKIAARHRVGADQVFMALFLRPGLNAIFSEHAFAIYGLVTAAAGGTGRPVPMKDGFFFDLDAIASAIDENTRIVFLDNPNNPTGTIFKRNEWERFLARVPERVVIVADEAYFEFVTDPDYPDSLRYHDGNRLIVTMRTFSKIFGLAGLRVGYAVARPDIIRMLNNVRQPFNVTSLGQVAVMAGMDDQEHVRRTLEVNAVGMRYLEREFRRLGLNYVSSHANFILADVGDGGAAFHRLLALGVIVRPMGGYGFPRHVRISVGLEAENQKLVAALEQVLARK
jgi:histidinol-phosphate aminotransferase